MENFSYFQNIFYFVSLLDISANPVMEIQPQTLMLGSNMSSGVTMTNFGKKFAKLRQCEQFEVQENSSENKASV